MKKLKDIILDSTYMSPAQVRFYTTDWQSNGTSCLIITDDMNQIIGCVDEALFGPTLSHNSCGDTLGGGHICLDPDSVMFIDDLERIEGCADVVYPLRWDQVMSSIAESPVQSRLGVLKSIVGLIKEGV